MYQQKQPLVFVTAVFCEERRDFAADVDVHDMLTKLCSKEAWGVCLSWDKINDLKVPQMSMI